MCPVPAPCLTCSCPALPPPTHSCCSAKWGGKSKKKKKKKKKDDDLYLLLGLQHEVRAALCPLGAAGCC